MVQVLIKHDIQDAILVLEDKFRRQVPFATSRALNQTAKIVQAEVVKELTLKLDRPTPFVLKSFFIKNSNKRDLKALVFLRDTPIGGKNPNSIADIIRQQFAGGNRIRTRLEGALTRVGLISDNEYLTPGVAAKLDQYGNMSRGQIQQLLSQLLASPNREANRTSSTRSKLSVKRAGRIFWSYGNYLPRGAYIEQGAGNGIRPLLLVVREPHYKQRIDLEVIGQRVVARDFDRIFKLEFEAAARTAR